MELVMGFTMLKALRQSQLSGLDMILLCQMLNIGQPLNLKPALSSFTNPDLKLNLNQQSQADQ
jgi:hypothetical protein